MPCIWVVPPELPTRLPFSWGALACSQSGQRRHAQREAGDELTSQATGGTSDIKETALKDARDHMGNGPGTTPGAMAPPWPPGALLSVTLIYLGNGHVGESGSVIYVNNEKEMWDIYDSILQSGAYSSEISTGQTCLAELYLNLKERGINLHFITGWYFPQRSLS